jgi:enoyl-CoA hydratase/carnithine racemase
VSGTEPGDETDELVCSQDGGVVVLRLNRPQSRNAMTFELLGAIGGAVNDAEADASVRAVVLTGTGDRAFCAGMDLRAFAAGASLADVPADLLQGFYRLVRGETTKPFVGAANGSALAGGLELLLGCDLIVASADAQFGLPEVKRGLFPGGGGTAIGLRVPLSIAMELTLTGRSVTAERAYEVGLVNAVVPATEVLDTAVGLAQEIEANSPLGVAACKELVRLTVVDAERANERLAHWQPVVFQSEDAIEGATAFVERRDPVWQGR